MSNKVKTNSILHHTKKTAISKAELLKSVEELGGNVYGFQNFIQEKISPYGAIVGLQSIKEFWTRLDRTVVCTWLFALQCYKEYLTNQKQGKTNE